ncbi:MAG: response regulator transcription factor [Sphingobacteriales bacterium]|nr:response regulator transcription factor [Sphingobacteriales bacterium]OJW05204.1 MAG: DNA-binding response regulator [Sphingobacteriales bacterium 44-61]
MITKLFIVDDHYLVIEGIRSMLQNEKNMEWMGHAMNAASCLAFLKHQQPDIIFMDINLPDKSGVDLCKEVSEQFPAVSILGLSTYNQQPVIRNMMDNGAMGYILKNATKQEILHAITTVRLGKTFLSFEAGQSLLETADDTPEITRREKEVLQLIAEGLTNAEIATKLFISVPTVNAHRKSLIEKFDATNTAVLIGKAIKSGII